MIPELRKKFNASFTEELYNKFINEINTSVRCPADFRIAETPVFLPEGITSELIKAGDSFISQIIKKDFSDYSAKAIPAGLYVPDETGHPEFLQIDFAVCLDGNSNLVPRLIELQGFPSLYGYQYLLDKITRNNFEIPENYSALFNGLDHKSYSVMLKDIIVADHNPENVILMEINPGQQKTRIDFAVTENITGIRTVDLLDIYQTGKNLYYKFNNREIKIERIYNRVIFDELERKKLKLNFKIFDELDVQWAGHPNWFFKISKHSLPFLRNEYNPHCYFLSELEKYPDNLEDYVLKPLYSFAGKGVIVELDRKLLNSIKDRNNYILQEKIQYAPLIETPDEHAKVEIRMMYLWKDNPVLVNNLVRMSKGKMMGVDYNKNKTWVGSSIAYHKV